MFRQDNKYVVLGLVVFLAGLLCCKGCISVRTTAKEQQTANEQRLRVLESERKVLAEKLQSQRQALRRLVQEYESTSLSSRYDMKLERVGMLLAELTEVELNKAKLGAEAQVLEQMEEKTAAVNERLFKVRLELKVAKVYEARLREILAEEDAEGIEMGRKRLLIQDLQFELDLDREMYDTVQRRIQELQAERERCADK